MHGGTKNVQIGVEYVTVPRIAEKISAGVYRIV
jgi:hypothetical protein